MLIENTSSLKHFEEGGVDSEVFIESAAITVHESVLILIKKFLQYNNEGEKYTHISIRELIHS